MGAGVDPNEIEMQLGEDSDEEQNPQQLQIRGSLEEEEEYGEEEESPEPASNITKKQDVSNTS
jgi:hypothetical protein